MFQHPVNELLPRISNRYSLVIALAKRAREIAEGAEPMTACSSDKEVTVAISELAADKFGVKEA